MQITYQNNKSTEIMNKKVQIYNKRFLSSVFLSSI
jgi:hypothetical protein